MFENCFCGYFFNWFRICNIVRVFGDEIDEDVVKLLGCESDEEDGEEESVVDFVDWRIRGKVEGDGERLSIVLYRD